MLRPRSRANAFAVVIASCLLAACAGDFEAQYPIVRMQSPEGALTRFTAPAMQNARQVHVSDLIAFEYVDYARYETPDFFLESVYDVATSESAVLQYDYTMERMIETWNFNKGKPITWGKPGTVGAWHGKVDIRPYRVGAAPARDCLAFNDEWDTRPQDILLRPTQVFFGYICAQPGTQLTQSQAAAIIASVRFSDIIPERLVPVDSRRSIDRAAFATAKGEPGGSTGNSAFPFNFGTIYTEGGQDQRSP